MRHVLGLSGKDSLAAALIIKAHDPELWESLEIFTTLTGADYPETLQWISVVPELMGKELVTIDGNALPSRNARYCTREAKLQPFEQWLGKDAATLYTGIRADEFRVGYKANDQVLSEFPLVKYEMDLAKVWLLILALPVQYRPPTFYWAEMHQLCRDVWDEQSPLFTGEFDRLLTFTQKVILMAGRSRPNCFFCFNQRRYEVVWMYETHPDLFERMQSFETLGYSWISDFPLADLSDAKRYEIKLRRAKTIVKAVTTAAFGAAVESDGFESMTSCGLFCGK